MEGLPLDAVMTTALVTAKPQTTVRDAVLLLDDMEIRHLPVVDGGKLVGIISDRDLREYRAPLMGAGDDPDQAAALLATPVTEVMNDQVVSVDTGEDVAAAIDVMLEYGVGAVTVVDRESSELVGIVSYVDILRAIRRGE
jgi:acetoin utilization protein AcuB